MFRNNNGLQNSSSPRELNSKAVSSRRYEDLLKGCFMKANYLISACCLPIPLVTSLCDINSQFFIDLFKVVCDVPLLDLKDEESIEDEIHNLQMVIDTLSLDVLQISLSHINSEDIITGQVEAIHNLLEVFEACFLYLSQDGKTSQTDGGSFEMKNEDSICSKCSYPTTSHRPTYREKSKISSTDKATQSSGVSKYSKSCDDIQDKKYDYDGKILKTSSLPTAREKGSEKPSLRNEQDSVQLESTSSQGRLTPKSSSSEIQRDSVDSHIKSSTQSSTSSSCQNLLETRPKFIGSFRKESRIREDQSSSSEEIRLGSSSSSSQEIMRGVRHKSTSSSSSPSEEESRRISHKSSSSSSETVPTNGYPSSSNGIHMLYDRPYNEKEWEEHTTSKRKFNDSSSSSSSFESDFKNQMVQTSSSKLLKKPRVKEDIKDKPSDSCLVDLCRQNMESKIKLLMENFVRDEAKVKTIRKAFLEALASPKRLRVPKCRKSYLLPTDVRLNRTSKRLKPYNTIHLKFPEESVSAASSSFECPVCLQCRPLSSSSSSKETSSDQSGGISKTFECPTCRQYGPIPSNSSSQEGPSYANGQTRKFHSQTNMHTTSRKVSSRNPKSSAASSSNFRKSFSESSLNHPKSSTHSSSDQKSSVSSVHRKSSTDSSSDHPKSSTNSSLDHPESSTALSSNHQKVFIEDNDENRPLLNDDSEDDEPAFIENIRKMLPGVNIPPGVLKNMKDKYCKHVLTLYKNVKNDLLKKPPMQIQAENAVKKQKALKNIIKKDLDHAQRLNDLKECENMALQFKAKMRDAETESIKLRQYYENYYRNFRKKLQNENNKEEVLFKSLFTQGMNVHTSEVRRLQNQLKERQRKEAHCHKIYVDALENLYQTQYNSLAESLASKDKMSIERAKFQEEMLKNMKKEMKRKMEKEIQDMQEKLIQGASDDSCFREYDIQEFYENIAKNTNNR